MALKKVNESELEVSVSINLVELYGQPVASSSAREEIAALVASQILNRTQAGYGVYNERIRRFPKYSAAYALKIDASRADVDLNDVGDMLGSISMLDNSPDYITVGIAGDQAPKAHGHQTGQYGVGPLPARPFIDITKEELSRIKTATKDLIKEKSARDVLNTQDEEVQFTESDIRSAIEQLKRFNITSTDTKTTVALFKKK